MVFKKVKKIIEEQLGDVISNKDGITMETNFQEDLEADSLDLFQIVNDIEDEFEVKIEDTNGLATVGDVVRLIESQL